LNSQCDFAQIMSGAHCANECMHGLHKCLTQGF
jgi:hypothetical protein